jgi:uncharacterized membrane protein
LQINKRGDTVDEKIRKLDAELVKYKEQIKRTRPGPAQEAVKARAMRLLKQKKMCVCCWFLTYLYLLILIASTRIESQCIIRVCGLKA